MCQNSFPDLLPNLRSPISLCNASHGSLSWGLHERLSLHIYVLLVMAQAYYNASQISSESYVSLVFSIKNNWWQFFNGSFWCFWCFNIPLIVVWCCGPLIVVWCCCPLIVVWCCGPLIVVWCCGPLIVVWCCCPLIVVWCCGPLIVVL